MKILVTGGAGYIGSQAVSALLKRGDEVLIIDNFTTGKRELVCAGARLYEVDLREREAVQKFFVENEVEAVLHFAAFSEVEESTREPEKYMQNNLEGTVNLLDGMKAAGVRKLVFSSTAATYGEPKEMPITEETPTEPINPYGVSKLKAEGEIRRRAEVGEIDAVIFRYFNVTGANEEGTLGEMRSHETHLVPIVLKRAKEGKAVSVFGTDYPTRDGTCVRDYIHVLDLVRAHVMALEFLSERSGVELFNLGSEQGFTVREVLAACKEVTGIDFEIKEEGRRAGDPPVLIASAKKAREVLGWRAERTLLDAVRTTWEFMQKSI